MKEGKRICNKCGGAGTLPPKEPEVIMVRIKGCSAPGQPYRHYIGKVHEVRKSRSSELYIVIGRDHRMLKKDFEPIPPIPEGYRLRRKYKDEELIEQGDRGWDGEYWVPTGLCHEMQAHDLIYITPIQPATPDPSADCLPGYEAVEVYRESPSPLLYIRTAHGGKYLAMMIGHASFSGRYGYKQAGGSILWHMTPRAFKERSTGEITTVALYTDQIPVLPDYVEMAKESE